MGTFGLEHWYCSVKGSVMDKTDKYFLTEQPTELGKLASRWRDTQTLIED